MTRFNPGDDVIVDFGGECRGEVIRHSGVWVMAVIIIEDPELDRGGVTPMLDPRPTVCVRDSRVRHAENKP